MADFFVVNEALCEMRKSPDHTSEQVSQAVLGSLLRKVTGGKSPDWIRVESEDGYRGWVRSWSVVGFSQADHSLYAAGPQVEIDALEAPVRERASGRSDAVRQGVLGARLPRLSRSGKWIRVLLPDGDKGFIHARDLLVDQRSLRGRRRPSHIPAVLRTAHRFLGLPYQWGGVTPKGLDCSGLVQTVFRLHRTLLPRDSKDQMKWVRRATYIEKDPMGVHPGHLVFFGESARKVTHVGIGLSEGRFLHAMGRVRISSLRPEHEDFHRELLRKFLGAGPVPMS